MLKVHMESLFCELSIQIYKQINSPVQKSAFLQNENNLYNADGSEELHIRKHLISAINQSILFFFIRISNTLSQCLIDETFDCLDLERNFVVKKSKKALEAELTSLEEESLSAEERYVHYQDILNKFKQNFPKSKNPSTSSDPFLQKKFKKIEDAKEKKINKFINNKLKLYREKINDDMDIKKKTLSIVSLPILQSPTMSPTPFINTSEIKLLNKINEHQSNINSNQSLVPELFFPYQGKKLNQVLFELLGLFLHQDPRNTVYTNQINKDEE